MEDEFELLPEAAAAIGRRDDPLPPARRVSVGDAEPSLSGVAWGDGPPEIIFLHGGSQNARTWDLTALALARPALAVDLPGHGRSYWRSDHDYTPMRNASALAVALDHVTPRAGVVVGMSLGGLTTIALSHRHPHLVPRAVLVDILPDLPESTSHPDRDRLVELRKNSSRRYRSRAEMVDEAMTVARHRSRESLARGVFHNSVQDADGLWRWRYDPERRSTGVDPAEDALLWQALPGLPPGSILVRGGASTFVQEPSLAELERRAPHIEVITVEGASHSVQSDRPGELASIIRRALAEG